MLGDLRALAIYAETSLELKTSAQYNAHCDALADELGDYDPKNAIPEPK